MGTKDNTSNSGDDTEFAISRVPRHSAFNPRPKIEPYHSPKPQKYSHKAVIDALSDLDLGSGIAEADDLLETARIETSAYSDLMNDRVDIIPGTKGSGKSALYRIFVEYRSGFIFDARRTVIAHGITSQGDQLFNAYKAEFDKFDESDFQNFWCVYLISLANSQFLELPRFQKLLGAHPSFIKEFQACCKKCKIPTANKKGALLEMFQQSIQWVFSFGKPTLRIELPNEAGTFEVEFGERGEVSKAALPLYLSEVKESLESILEQCGLKLWFMIDRLDEIFPRQSNVEKLAMRGLLRTAKLFRTEHTRVKLFIRDDMLSSVVAGKQGFAALSHIVDRKADTLRWTEEQLLSMIVKRLCTSVRLRQMIGIEKKQVDHEMDLRREAFYRIFPPTGDGRKKGSPTMRWIYTHLADGHGVVTPRDVIQLVTTAKQKQQSLCQESPNESCDFVIGPKALKHALEELSKLKRDTYLKAEFPDRFTKIKKLIGGKTDFSGAALKRLYGESWESVAEDFVSLGIFREERKRGGHKCWKVPFVYRAGLQLKQGQANGETE